MKKYICFLVCLSAFCLNAGNLSAQSLAVKKIVAKYETDYIPEFKSSLAYRSNNPALAKIDVEIDFASFGEDASELDLAVRELNMVKGALLFLAKDAAGKAAIEKNLKKVTISKAAEPKGKKLLLSNGNLMIATHSFDLRTLVGTPEIQKYLEAAL